MLLCIGACADRNEAVLMLLFCSTQHRLRRDFVLFTAGRRTWLTFIIQRPTSIARSVAGSDYAAILSYSEISTWCDWAGISDHATLNTSKVRRKGGIYYHPIQGAATVVDFHTKWWLIDSSSLIPPNTPLIIEYILIVARRAIRRRRKYNHTIMSEKHWGLDV